MLFPTRSLSPEPRPQSSSSSRTYRLRRPLLALIVAVGLGAALPAQSLGVDVTHFDQQSGVPQQAADEFGISMFATPSSQMVIELWGGKPGALAGISIGRLKTSIPIFGAKLLVVPDLLFFTVFDGNGKAQFSFPLIEGLKLKVQGIQMDLVKPSSLFTFTWGLDFHVRKKAPAPTDFDVELARTLMDLSHDAYEDPTRKGRIKPGMRLAGGFQVLARLESPNPKTLFYSLLKWPDTQLFIARNPSSDLAVVFRGTDLSNPRDIFTNLNSKIVEGIHDGKRLAYLSVQDKIKAALTKETTKNTRVFFSGHSLGGGLATIGAYSLAHDFLAKLGVAKNDVVMYSFAASRSLAPPVARDFGVKVPHHYAVVNKDDIVTHFSPLGALEHVPSMRVLYPRRAMIAENGAQYKAGGLGLLVPRPAAHYQVEYEARLREVLPPPEVSMSVSATGNMVIHWSFPQREKYGFLRDFVALYRGDPRSKGTSAFLLGGWQWASAKGSYETSWPKGEGFYVAYIQEYFLLGERKFLATSGEFKRAQAKLSLTRTNGLITLNWDYDEAGKFDWVGVYYGIPTDPKDYLCGGKSWNWAVGRKSHVTNWQEARNLYIGYVAQETLRGPGKIVQYEGPFSFVNAPTVGLTTYYSFPFYFFEVNYGNARVNTFDWVAVYDRDPEAAGAVRLSLKLNVTGSGSKRTAVVRRSGAWAAHFEQDCLLSPPRLVSKWGPFQ